MRGFHACWRHGTEEQQAADRRRAAEILAKDPTTRVHTDFSRLTLHDSTTEPAAPRRPR
jgi:hypothetical protein